MQTDAPAIPRLELPAYYYWNEGLHGIARSGYATVFPQAVGLAATWNTGLHHKGSDDNWTRGASEVQPGRA